MKKRISVLFLLGVTVLFFFSGGPAWANKAEATIEVPQTVVQGSEITIRVTVHHDANNFLHYTNWLWIKVNEKEIARWDYTASQRPKGATFTKEVKYKADGPMEIKAKANCNVHGSAGEAEVKVQVKQ
jgi:desulfoferrodoxin (superoxide reductase-like protein)